MPNQVTMLLERALSSTSDEEKLECLNQIKKIYRNESVKELKPDDLDQPSYIQDSEKSVYELELKIQDFERNQRKLVWDLTHCQNQNSELKKRFYNQDYCDIEEKRKFKISIRELSAWLTVLFLVFHMVYASLFR